VEKNQVTKTPEEIAEEVLAEQGIGGEFVTLMDRVGKLQRQIFPISPKPES
jgi:hypothetical protein